MKATLSILIIALLAPMVLTLVQAYAGETRPTPSIQVEFVWTEVRAGKTDLFMLITNQNDFDVYVAGSGSSATTRSGTRSTSTTFGDGPPCCFDAKDYTLLPGKAKRLLRWWREYSLDPGPNRFHIETCADRDPRLPWNYVVVGCRQFNFVIVNPDTLSR